MLEAQECIRAHSLLLLLPVCLFSQEFSFSDLGRRDERFEKSPQFFLFRLPKEGMLALFFCSCCSVAPSFVLREGEGFFTAEGEESSCRVKSLPTKKPPQPSPIPSHM